MKAYLLASAALVGLLGGSALAADLPVKAKPIVCTGCDWSGFYIGVNAGGSIGRSRADDSLGFFPPGTPGAIAPGISNPVSTVSASSSPAGALGGGQLGFNWQSGNVVLGAEADWDWTGARDSIQTQSFFAATQVFAPANLTTTNEQKLNWLATVRARLGWAHDYFLWYATGGVAFGEVQSNYNFQVTEPTVFGFTPTTFTGAGSLNSSTTKTGWTIGGGVETSLAWLGGSSRWSTKIEYLYVDLGTVSNTFTVPVPGNPGSIYTYTSSVRVQDHIVRAGLNYRFNDGINGQATKVAAMPCTTCDWRGFYIGANLGGSIGRFRTDDSVSLFPPGSLGTVTPGVSNPISSVSATSSPEGWIGGGQVGFNWQSGSWVLGAEGDWNWTNQRDTINRSSFISSTFAVANAVVNYSDEQKIKWLATARGRLGWSQGSFLWFATGGIAFGEVESNYNFQVNPTFTSPPGLLVFGTAPASASSSTTKTGWTVGGGVETSLPWLSANRWSAKLEYLYVDLGSVSTTFTVPVTGVAGRSYTYTSTSSIQDNIVRVGVNYRFGG